MRLVTAEMMRSIDDYAINTLGIPGLDLMEKAGVRAARVLEREAGLTGGTRAVVVCGKGNNGGDGFVIARDLLSRGVGVDVFLLGRAGDVSGDARTNLDRLEPGVVSELTQTDELPALVESLATADAVVDAVFGTGFEGAPRGIAGDAIRLMNASGRPVMAVDVPSGLHAATGVTAGECVLADWTCTMALPKRGFLLNAGPRAVGELFVVDIGIPDEALEAIGVRESVLMPWEAGGLLPGRPWDANKGTCGRVVVVAGAAGYTGAATLTAMSALRSGAGLVFAAAPGSLNDILETKLTEAITWPMPETHDRTLAIEALQPLLDLTATTDALAVGPGLTTHPETVKVVRELVRALELPFVLDADGLNAHAIDEIGERPQETPLVLTPHPGELARLMDRTIEEVQGNRPGAALEAAERARAVVVLKGAGTVVAEPGGESYLTPTGGPGLATAGTGDVLTGVIASFLGQGLGAFDAAVLGAYAHGLAGDLAASRVGRRGMVASDVVESLPGALYEIEGAMELGGA